MSLPTLAAILGHASIQMTMRYVPPAAEEKQLAMEKSEKFRAEGVIGAARLQEVTGSLQKSLQWSMCKERGCERPERSRTSDLLVRTVIRPYSKPWSALLFCNLREGPTQKTTVFAPKLRPCQFSVVFSAGQCARSTLGKILPSSLATRHSGSGKEP
jgi:hypothetical protein